MDLSVDTASIFPEGGGGVLLRNVGISVEVNAALQPRRQTSESSLPVVLIFASSTERSGQELLALMLRI